MEKREQQCIDYIQLTVGRKKSVLMLVSGGVNFAVSAAPFHEALLQVITRRECRASISILIFFFFFFFIFTKRYNMFANLLYLRYSLTVYKRFSNFPWAT